MAFTTGIHVTCFFVSQVSGASLAEGTPAWSQTMASAGTTTSAAPDKPSYRSDLNSSTMTVSAAVDAFVAIGSAPDATNSPRWLIRAGADRDFATHPGDRLAWIAA